MDRQRKRIEKESVYMNPRVEKEMKIPDLQGWQTISVLAAISVGIPRLHQTCSVATRLHAPTWHLKKGGRWWMFSNCSSSAAKKIQIHDDEKWNDGALGKFPAARKCIQPV